MNVQHHFAQVDYEHVDNERQAQLMPVDTAPGLVTLGDEQCPATCLSMIDPTTKSLTCIEASSPATVEQRYP